MGKKFFSFSSCSPFMPDGGEEKGNFPLSNDNVVFLLSPYLLLRICRRRTENWKKVIKKIKAHKLLTLIKNIFFTKTTE